ncbi:hypothetical protein PHMEG_0007682 [Phytophthora megakarya]|uniref:Reverse transcriptase n=1 Tax=Phytophthora megakarya TaxID=4795 RepID=A0A225WKT8_9STRA|nr:hypothetical protein PHMEG_0007682 [Phytophthora megakarya]
MSPWQQDRWTSRIMAVEMDDWLIVNTYAPALNAERKKSLELWLQNHDSIILAGDFNCVLRPGRDRITNRKPSTAPWESRELKTLIDNGDFSDAVDLKYYLQTDFDTEEEEMDPLNHFTFWCKEGASRLDRFYVKGEPFTYAQWLDVIEPAHDSDHHEIRFELKSNSLKPPRSKAPSHYPIPSGKLQRIRKSIEDQLVPLLEKYEQSKNPVGEWDELVSTIQKLLNDVRKQDRTQTQSYFQKLRAESRVPGQSRKEIVADIAQKAGDRAARSFGKSLRGSEEETRRFFKRNSNWQRDQTISYIKPSPGHFYDDDYPIEERMASEWSHAFGASHASMPPEQINARFDNFVNISEHINARFDSIVNISNHKKLSEEDAQNFMSPITETETWQAINHLQRHKTPGTTGLNHDFHKDFSDLLTPSLTLLYSAILQGKGKDYMYNYRDLSALTSKVLCAAGVLTKPLRFCKQF